MFEKNETELEMLEGSVDFVHQFVDMPEYTFDLEDPLTGSVTPVLDSINIK